MKLSAWQISTLVLLSILIGQHFSTTQLVPEASAAPRDVHGSPLTAVTCYRNRAGNFILWSDGRISTVTEPNTNISELHNYSDIPGLARVNLSVKAPKGSPNVPVGAYQDSKGSYVLFADGTSRKPAGIAGAPGLNGSSVRTARCDTSRGGFDMYPEDSGLFIQGTGSIGHYILKFDPPFKSPPTVTISSQSMATVDGPTSTTEVGVSTAFVIGGPTITQYQNMMFTVTAIGE